MSGLSKCVCEKPYTQDKLSIYEQVKDIKVLPVTWCNVKPEIFMKSGFQGFWSIRYHDLESLRIILIYAFGFGSPWFFDPTVQIPQPNTG